MAQVLLFAIRTSYPIPRDKKTLQRVSILVKHRRVEPLISICLKSIQPRRAVQEFAQSCHGVRTLSFWLSPSATR